MIFFRNRLKKTGQCIDNAIKKEYTMEYRGDIMSNTTISIRVNEEVKKEADQLFENLGLNLSSAVNIFLRQAIREQGIPFQVTLNEGRIYQEAEDFIDDHMAAFKELAK